MQFIEFTGAGFVTGPTGKGWVDETHPQFHGVFGFAGHDSARALFQCGNVDLIIAIGTELEELGTSGWTDDLLNTKLVHIDSTVEHFTRSPMANLHVFGEISSIFDRLIECVKTARNWGRKWTPLPAPHDRNIMGSYVSLREEEKCFSVESPIKPQRLMYALNKKLPEQTRIFVDAGNAWAWVTHYLVNRNSDGHCHFGMGFGSMAWAIGASIGAAIGNRKVPTLCIVGDGSYLMAAQEITVAAQQQLPVVFLVLNDSALGMVKHGQRLGNQESIGWELNTINFAAMAQAMGVDGQVIETPQQLNALDFKKLFSRSGPTLLDFRIDAEEIPPMGDRIKGLADNESATPGG
jgi:acetolactate synthase-1/2/3 large subunit